MSKTRTVFNLVNGAVITSDPHSETKQDAEENIRENMLPQFGEITHFSVICGGSLRVINKEHVTDFYVEQIDA